MKLKKIFLTIAIIALLSLTFVFAVSASEYDFIASADNSVGSDLVSLSLKSFAFDPSGDGSGLAFNYLTDDQYECFYIRPVDFKKAVLFIQGGLSSYSDFQAGCESIFNISYVSDATKHFCNLWMNGYYGCDEAYFNKLIDYKEITQEELDEKDAQIENMSGLLESMDATLYEQQRTISTLESENATLQSENATLQVDVESLETQVADLVGEKTTINSELMALDAKLEREVSKAYLQGVDDATSFSWTPIVVGLSVVSMLLTIVSLCIRGKKKKR